MSNKKNELEALAAEWNRTVKIGDIIEYPPEAYGAASDLRRTRTAAEVLGTHAVVVRVEGISGCIDIRHCTPVREQEGAKCES